MSMSEAKKRGRPKKAVAASASSSSSSQIYFGESAVPQEQPAARAARAPKQPRAAQSGPPDFEPPLSVVNRVLKESLPVNVLLTRDARSAFARAAGIFICYVTHCANDIAQASKRSTISAADVMGALRELDLQELEVRASPSAVCRVPCAVCCMSCAGCWLLLTPPPPRHTRTRRTL